MKLFYRKFGNGPPLIILHGLYGSSDNWVSIAKNLAGSFTVYLPDLRNHGQSPHSGVHDYDSMSDDLFELVTDLRLKKIFLAGHSMGGKAAIAFAVKWPEIINGLLVADISPFTSEKREQQVYNQHINILETILSVDLSSVNSRSDAENLLLKTISAEKVRGIILKNLQRNPGNKFTWKLNPSSLYKNLDKIMAAVDLREALLHPVTGFPVIFLRGSNSDHFFQSDMEEIKKIFPAAELIEISGAGHWVNADNPEEVTISLKKLLSDY